MSIVWRGYLGLQPYKILAILYTTTLESTKSLTFSHTVLLRVVCGFTVLYATLTNGL